MRRTVGRPRRRAASGRAGDVARDDHRPAAARRWRNPQLLALGAAWIVFAFVAAACRHRGLSFFDANEYAAHIAGGGIPHAPGYPLYVMLGKLLLPCCHDPFTAQFVINLAASAAAAGLVFATVSRSGGRAARWGGLVGGLLLLSGFYFRLYVELPEVFALNAALLALLTYVAVRWYASPSPRLIAVAGLVYGLGVCHHHSLALTLPGAVLLLLLRRQPLPRLIASLAGALGGFVIGLLPLAYLFYARTLPHRYSYYEVATLRELLFVVLRRGYGTFSLAPTAAGAGVLRHASVIVRGLAQNLNYVNVLVAAAAAGALLRCRRQAWSALGTRAVTIFCGSTLLVFLLVFSTRARLPLTSAMECSVLLRFVTIPGLMLALLVGVGVSHLPACLPPARVTAALAAVTTVVAASAVYGARDLDFRSHESLTTHLDAGLRHIQRQMARSSTKALHPDREPCVIFSRADSVVFGLRYLDTVGRAPGCYLFSPTAFTGEFRGRAEEELGEAAFAARGGIRLSDWSGPEELISALLARLLELRYRVYLFVPKDAGFFLGTSFGVRPAGNVLELVVPGASRTDYATLSTDYVDYLELVDGYLDRLERHPTSPLLLDESSVLGLFADLNVYPALLRGHRPPGGDAAAPLEAEVRDRYARFAASLERPPGGRGD